MNKFIFSKIKMWKFILGFILFTVCIIIVAIKQSIPKFSNPVDVKVLQAKFNFWF